MLYNTVLYNTVQYEPVEQRTNISYITVPRIIMYYMNNELLTLIYMLH